MSINKKMKGDLITGLNALQLDVETEALLTYLNLLQKWNKAYNLTAVKAPNMMLTKHVLDSLSIAPFVEKKDILDVGTGAGLPGIPLAICFPHKQFVLMDSNGKKTRFLTEVKRQLGLSNVLIEQIRVENYKSDKRFDVIVSRAFSAIDKMLELTQHLIAKDGVWLAMKSDITANERDAINHFDFKIMTLDVPHLDAKRQCIKVMAM